MHVQNWASLAHLTSHFDVILTCSLLSPSVKHNYISCGRLGEYLNQMSFVTFFMCFVLLPVACIVSPPVLCSSLFFMRMKHSILFVTFYSLIMESIKWNFFSLPQSKKTAVAWTREHGLLRVTKMCRVNRKAMKLFASDHGIDRFRCVVGRD